MFSKRRKNDSPRAQTYSLITLSYTATQFLTNSGIDVNMTPVICNEIQRSDLHPAQKKYLIHNLFIDYEIIIMFLSMHQIDSEIIKRILNLVSTEQIDCLANIIQFLGQYDNKHVIQTFLKRFVENPYHFLGLTNALCSLFRFQGYCGANITTLLSLNEMNKSAAFCLFFVRHQYDFNLLIESLPYVDKMQGRIMRLLSKRYQWISSTDDAIRMKLDDASKGQLLKQAINYARSGWVLYALFKRSEPNAINDLPLECVEQIVKQLG